MDLSSFLVIIDDSKPFLQPESKKKKIARVSLKINLQYLLIIYSNKGKLLNSKNQHNGF